jgi:hypothetical protein
MNEEYFCRKVGVGGGGVLAERIYFSLITILLIVVGIAGAGAVVAVCCSGRAVAVSWCC